MYHPKQSLWASPPKRRYHRNALDAIVYQTYWTPQSAGAIAGRLIRPRIEWRVISPLAPVNAKPLPIAAQLELPLYIDSSMLTTWRACKSKHLWSTLHGLYPTGKSVHLIAGAAIAAGVEAARKRVFANRDAPQHEALQAAYMAFAREWGDYEPQDTPYLQKTFENSFTALAAYLKEYPPSADPVQPMVRSDGSPAVEYTFAVELPILHPSGDPFLFVGRFDLLGYYNDLPVILDEKTTGQFTSDWAEKWDLRGQFLGYCWALQQQGLDIRDVIVRGIGIFKTKTENKTAHVHYPQFLIDRWAQQMLRDVQAIANAYSQLQAGALAPSLYDKNFGDSCDSYGGCAFKTLCTANEPLDYFSNYLRHRWNPLSKQPVEELE